MLKRIDSDWRYSPGPFIPSVGVRYQGHDGYRAMLDSIGWRDGSFEIDVEHSRVDPYVLTSGWARLETADGEVRSYPTASLHLVRDGCVHWSGGFADEREALDAVAFTPDEEFKLAFDMAPDAMVLLDDEGRIVHANRAAADLLALPQRDLRGLRIGRFLPPELRDRAVESWQPFKRDGRAGGMTAMIAADGSRPVLEYRAVTDYIAGRHLVIGRRRDGGDSRPGEGAVLTPRQREVLRMLALGLNGPEAAARLFLSPATVRTHVQNAMQALGAKTRAQAVAEAVIRGELELHPRDYGKAE